MLLRRSSLATSIAQRQVVFLSTAASRAEPALHSIPEHPHLGSTPLPILHSRPLVLMEVWAGLPPNPVTQGGLAVAVFSCRTRVIPHTMACMMHRRIHANRIRPPRIWPISTRLFHQRAPERSVHMNQARASHKAWQQVSVGFTSSRQRTLSAPRQ
jgi:hypothetical protein